MVSNKLNFLKKSWSGAKKFIFGTVIVGRKFEKIAKINFQKFITVRILTLQRFCNYFLKCDKFSGKKNSDAKNYFIYLFKQLHFKLNFVLFWLNFDQNSHI